MKLTIPGELTDLNTYIDAERSNLYKAAGIKKEMTELCAWVARPVKTEIKTPVTIKFKWITKDEMKDPDNVAFAKKFILDGFVKARLLPNDGRKQIKAFADEFAVDKKNPRVEVEICEVET